MSEDFVNSPITGPDFQKQGNVPSGSAGDYDGGGCPEFDVYRRTSSGNAVKEKFYEKAVQKPSGEPDQFA